MFARRSLHKGMNTRRCCTWLIFLMFLCSGSRKKELTRPIPLHLATSYILALGRVGHLSGTTSLVRDEITRWARLGCAITGSLVHKVKRGHAQQRGSVGRSCPGHVKGIGNSTPRAWKRQRSFLYPSFAHSLYLRSREKRRVRGKELFENRSSYILDKLKEMLLYRVESNLVECFIPKAKKKRNINGLKNINDIVINYVYKNNLND